MHSRCKQQSVLKPRQNLARPNPSAWWVLPELPLKSTETRTSLVLPCFQCRSLSATWVSHLQEWSMIDNYFIKFTSLLHWVSHQTSTIMQFTELLILSHLCFQQACSQDFENEMLDPKKVDTWIWMWTFSASPDTKNNFCHKLNSCIYHSQLWIQF